MIFETFCQFWLFTLIWNTFAHAHPHALTHSYVPDMTASLCDIKGTSVILIKRFRSFRNSGPLNETRGGFVSKELNMKNGIIFFDLWVNATTLSIISALIAHVNSVWLFENVVEIFIAERKNKIIGCFVTLHYSNMIYFRCFKERPLRKFMLIEKT